MNAGKTTVSNYLVHKFNLTHYALADKLKEFLVDLFDILHEDNDEIDTIQLIDLYRRDRKEQYRYLLQHIGTDLMRSYDSKFWTKQLIKHLPEDDFVIDDIRFREEMNDLKARYPDAIVIRVKRLDEIKSEHISEHELDNYEADHILYNDTTIEDLKMCIDFLLP